MRKKSLTISELILLFVVFSCYEVKNSEGELKKNGDKQIFINIKDHGTHTVKIIGSL